MPAQPRTTPPPTRRRNRRQTLHHLRHQRRSPAYPHGRSMHQLPPQMETQTRPRIPQADQRLPASMAAGASQRIPRNETPLRAEETSKGTPMSVKTYTDSTTRIITKTIEEHVWEIRCNAIGCNNSLEFREKPGHRRHHSRRRLHRRHGHRMAQHPRHQHRHQNRTPTRLARRQQRHTTRPPLLPHTQRKPIKHQQPKKKQRRRSPA